MVGVEITVALFEVLFLYRELIDAITPWLAQQGIELGVVGTLGLAFLGWTGVRGMTWFLFGRFGTPALLAILGRQAMEGQQGAARPSPAADLEFWRGPINALKAEHEWFKKEAQHLVELLTPRAPAGGRRVQLPGCSDHGQAALHAAVPVAGPSAPQHADFRDRQDPHGRGRWVVTRRVAALAVALGVVACSPSERAAPTRSTLVIGMDISGSFRRNPNFSGAIEFAALYIYAHLNGMDGLQTNTAIFVGELGGERPGQAKVFHPIQDLSGKTPAQIAADLRAWFPQEDPITDFNAFFQRAALHVRRNNLVLAPLNVVLFSDGEPDYPSAGRVSLEQKYERVDLSPLEYLSRNVTVRLLYADPPIAQLWERKVPRKRVRLWTQDAEVMKGWRRHMVDGVPMVRQDSLWSWVEHVVDVRVKRERVL